MLCKNFYKKLKFSFASDGWSQWEFSWMKVIENELIGRSVQGSQLTRSLKETFNEITFLKPRMEPKAYPELVGLRSSYLFKMFTVRYFTSSRARRIPWREREGGAY